MANLRMLYDDLSDDSDLFIETPPSFGASYSQSGMEGSSAQVQGKPSSREPFEPKTSAKPVKQLRKNANADQEARRKQRIQDVVSKYKSSLKSRDDRLEVIVSRQVYDEKDRGMLRELKEILRPEQISYDNRSMSHLISWRLKPIDSSSPYSDVPVSLLVLTAADYVDHMHKKTLHNLCQGLKRELPGQKVMLVVCGVDNYCRRTARKAFKGNGAESAAEGHKKKDSIRYGKAAVQDSYTLLFLDYGIRTHDILNDEELGHFICDVSHAVAKTPNYKNKAYLESFLTYKTKRAKKSTAPLLNQRDKLDSYRSYDDSDDANVIKGVPTLSGEDLRAAYLQMLVQIPGVSADMAGAIQNKYPTLQILLKALQNCESNFNVLSEVQYGKTNRRIGAKQFETIAKILTSLDPNLEC
ncbi:ERCC4 [Gracilaria domingensis]|nr:ERCC4 [Gracilaria domingensis]